MRILIAIDTWGLVGGTERYARVAAPILREAGGLVSRPDGRALRTESADILAGNQQIHLALLKTLKGAKSSSEVA